MRSIAVLWFCILGLLVWATCRTRPADPSNSALASLTRAAAARHARLVSFDTINEARAGVDAQVAELPQLKVLRVPCGAPGAPRPMIRATWPSQGKPWSAIFDPLGAETVSGAYRYGLAWLLVSAHAPGATPAQELPDGCGLWLDPSLALVWPFSGVQSFADLVVHRDAGGRIVESNPRVPGPEVRGMVLYVEGVAIDAGDRRWRSAGVLRVRF